MIQKYNFLGTEKTFQNYQKQFRWVVNDGNGGYKVDVSFQLKIMSESQSRACAAAFEVEEGL